jgi:CubicO group peptidase (beta-lactamase class C family)
MLTVQLTTPKKRNQGLTWYGDEMVGGALAWGHGGSDPGINTDIRMLPEQKLAAIVMTNTNGIKPQDFTRTFLEAAVAS